VSPGVPLPARVLMSLGFTRVMIHLVLNEEFMLRLPLATPAAALRVAEASPVRKSMSLLRGSVIGLRDQRAIAAGPGDAEHRPQRAGPGADRRGLGEGRRHRP